MNIKQKMPGFLKPPLRTAREAVLDGFDWLRPHDANHPPRPLQRLVGDGDFQAIGEQILEELKTRAALQPDERVLDVGCGIGRVAMPLTRFLSEQGTYEGFDIMPRAIEWCQKKIAPFYPHFRFQLADIHSVYYNPRGTQ